MTPPNLESFATPLETPDLLSVFFFPQPGQKTKDVSIRHPQKQQNIFKQTTPYFYANFRVELKARAS